MNITSVQRGIRPILIKHRVEVLFWGLRELKRIQMMAVQAPRVEIEIAGKMISSGVIQNIRKCQNFDDNIKFLEDVELPDNWYWSPPISIKVIDCRTFGREQLVGTHICHNLSKFRYPRVKDAGDDKIGVTSPFKSEYSATNVVSNVNGGGANVMMNPLEAMNGGGAGGVPLDGTVNIGGKSEAGDGAPGEDEEEDLDTPQLDWWSKYRMLINAEELDR